MLVKFTDTMSSVRMAFVELESLNVTGKALLDRTTSSWFFTPVLATVTPPSFSIDGKIEYSLVIFKTLPSMSLTVPPLMVNFSFMVKVRRRKKRLSNEELVVIVCFQV
uniref:Uncharacterized protein n=1 Tax=Lotus japonicus TaxID=34305 RepID=I3SWR9_LOTJA|nr:unknown [Lotus japonicus]